MSESQMVACRCGRTRLELIGTPIMVDECLCNSCRTAAQRLALLLGAENILTQHLATPCAEFRKDRVRILSGQAQFGDFRLQPDAGTRRVIATCCHTPIFMEMKGAHWLSVYLHLWPQASRPLPKLRTMVADFPQAAALPNDMPNLKTHSAGFYAKLLLARMAMGFRVPKFEANAPIEA